MDREADCVQSMACLFTIHAAAWKFQHYTCQLMCTFSGTAFVDKRNSIPHIPTFIRDLSLPLHGYLHEALCIIHEANCGLGVGG